MMFLIDFLLLAISVLNAAVTVAIVIALMPWSLLGAALEPTGSSSS